jgi:hypothetical protein
MPIKFGPTVVKHVKTANGTTSKFNQHTYLSGVSTKVLEETIDKPSIKPKYKDKLMKELVKRKKG